MRPPILPHIELEWGWIASKLLRVVRLVHIHVHTPWPRSHSKPYRMLTAPTRVPKRLGKGWHVRVYLFELLGAGWRPMAHLDGRRWRKCAIRQASTKRAARGRWCATSNVACARDSVFCVHGAVCGCGTGFGAYYETGGIAVGDWESTDIP